MFLSKILTSVIGGLILTIGSALAFTETDTIQHASQFVQKAQNKIVQYEENEQNLVSLLHTVQSDANSKIDQANEVIANLENNVMTLQLEVRILEEEIAQLEEELNQTKADKEALTKELLTLRQEHLIKLEA